MRSATSSRPRAGRKAARLNSTQRRLRRQTRAAHNHIPLAKRASPVCGPDDCTPREEIILQDDIHREALAIIDSARASLNDLARRSQEIRSFVSCDQEDWPTIIRDCLEDMTGDTFGCLPDAIERAARDSDML